MSNQIFNINFDLETIIIVFCFFLIYYVADSTRLLTYYKFEYLTRDFLNKTIKTEMT